MKSTAQLDDTVLSAPFAGTIARRSIDDGEVVAAGRTLFRLVETNRLEARIGLSPRAAAAIHTGQSAEVRVGNRTGQSKLTTLMPELDARTRTRGAVFSLGPAMTSLVVAGQVAEVTVAERVSEAGFWLPTTALVRNIRGMWSCFAAVPLNKTAGRNGLYRIVRRDLEALFVDGDRVYVRGTIRDADEIVQSGAHRVVPGQIVQRRNRTATNGPHSEPGSGRPVFEKRDSRKAAP